MNALFRDLFQGLRGLRASRDSRRHHSHSRGSERVGRLLSTKASMFALRGPAPAERDDERGLVDAESDDKDRYLAANDLSCRRSPHQFKPNGRRDAGRRKTRIEVKTVFW
jgi:hypothetical protein